MKSPADLREIRNALLAGVANTADFSSLGSINLLQTAILTITSEGTAAAVCDPLKQINNLRQGYPAHGDNAKRFLDAHRFFKLSYPIVAFTDAWESVLKSYFSSMTSLRDTLSREWNNRA